MVVYVDHERDALAGLLYRTGPDTTSLRLDAVPVKYPICPTLVTPLPGDTLHQFMVGHGKQEATLEQEEQEERSNPNISNGFSAALSCYPVVKQIARSVDLNTLHALSLTCRQFHANLMPFRNQLVRETLRCRNESLDEVVGVQKNNAVPRRISDREFSRLTTGKVGQCARDMVSECQRCAGIICRNCTMKPLSKAMLKNRFRRLCSTCLDSPLSDHLGSHLPSLYNNSNSQEELSEPVLDLTPCSCEDATWLCRPCGQFLRSDDTTYRRVWTWRNRYSTYFSGGLSTGIGDGGQGVTCGRGERCLAAEDIEVVIDCEVDEWTTMEQNENFHGYHNNSHGHGHHGPGEHLQVDPRDDGEPGYLRQEIVGVGGIVKQKVKKWVRVGASVEEYDDERETTSFLRRESLGQARSWCGWCSRVIPSKDEVIGSGIIL
ncbi:hypothetical protein AJ80_08557 [Polytolypa hystricis UAMH7299]|uniref:F-box domain-containing protein n=1 Tax=Polytolypa hystricis (strain UAMH7299) TaxID=1447883 RepID=A0A2B7X649_POLH7|nr:hypothetical protein AJ80_08557 [Polytolypa hystricis UAMH7299]